jgi:hypothetical protein
MGAPRIFETKRKDQVLAIRLLRDRVSATALHENDGGPTPSPKKKKPKTPAKTLVKPQNNSTHLQSATYEWHFSYPQSAILNIVRKKAPVLNRGFLFE